MARAAGEGRGTVSDDTTGDTIRRAAALMAGRAESARCDGMSKTPWREGKQASCGCCMIVTDATGGQIASVDDRQSAHIASWDPAMAEAVADLLNEIARQYEAPPCDAPAGACSACEWREDFTDALRLARAYLGEAAS